MIYLGNVLTHMMRTSNGDLKLAEPVEQLRVVKVNLVGNNDHNSGNPELTNGPALEVVDEGKDVAEIFVEVSNTKNILAEEGVTKFVGDEGEVPAHQNSSLSCLGLRTDSPWA